MKKRFQKITAVLLSALLLTTIIFAAPITTEAAEIIDSGWTGDCEWKLDENGVLTISGYGAMADSWLSLFADYNFVTSIIIRFGVTTIGAYSFRDYTNLKSVTIPNSVTQIRWYAFENCTSLTNINIPNSVTEICGYVFDDCSSLESIIIPNGVVRIDQNAFQGCTSLTGITIPDSVVYLGEQCFNCCSNLQSAVIGNSIESINGNTFYCCSKLTDLSIGKSVEAIYNSAFAGCTSLTTLTVPDSVETICDNAFSGCTGLTSVSLGKSVKVIEQYAFVNCTSLKNMEMGASVNFINRYAFHNCNNLLDIYYSGSNNNWKNINILDYNDSLKKAYKHYGYISYNNELNFSKDVWSFSNYTDKRCCSEEEYGFKNPYINQLKPSSRAAIDAALSDGSEGHCFGMSAAVILQKMGIDDLTKWSKATCLNNVEPYGNARNRTCYYQATQYFWDFASEVQKFQSYSVKDQLTILAERADKVKNGGNPVFFCFGNDYWGEHAVVAYALEPGSFKSSSTGKRYNNRVLLYDCNAVNWSEDTCLLFNWGTDEWEIPYYGSDISSSNDAYLMCATNDTSVFDGIDDLEQEYDFGICPVIRLNCNENIVLTKKNTGEKWTINAQNGEIQGASKLFHYRDTAYANNADNTKLNIVLPDSTSEYVFETETKEPSEFSISALCSDKYLSAESSSANGATISLDGAVSINDNRGEFEICVADNKMQEEESYDTFSISGNNKGETTLSISENGVNIEGESIKGINVEASNNEYIGTKTIEETTVTELSNSQDDYTSKPKTYEKEYIIGDVNGDGTVNGADAGLLSRYTSGWKDYESKIKNMAAADINGDGTVNGADSGILARHTSGWKQYAKYFEG